MRDTIVIVGMARTPFGSFQGGLSSVAAPKLGAIALKEAVSRAGIKLEDVSEVIMGNVLAAGSGQAPARQAAMYAGIPESSSATTVNKVCGSGMQSLIMAARSLQLYENDIVACGGMENMSQSPYLLKEARDGFSLGHQKMIDSMVHDGLWDPYDNMHMGQCAEICAREKKFTREDQDRYAVRSFERALQAVKEGKLKEEIVPVEIQLRKKTIVVDQDEGPSKVKFEKIPLLRPAFDKEGTITAANASTINDGACALILMREETAEKLGLKPLAKIISYARHAQTPKWFTTAPIKAISNAIVKANWKLNEVDFFEVNEAFSVVALAAQKELKIPDEKLNPRGGAISLGHPIGASGTRIVMSVISALKQQEKKRGVAAICIGGGEALAMCIEKM